MFERRSERSEPQCLNCCQLMEFKIWTVHWRDPPHPHHHTHTQPPPSSISPRRLRPGLKPGFKTFPDSPTAPPPTAVSPPPSLRPRGERCSLTHSPSIPVSSTGYIRPSVCTPSASTTMRHEGWRARDLTDKPPDGSGLVSARLKLQN